MSAAEGMQRLDRSHKPQPEQKAKSGWLPKLAPNAKPPSNDFPPLKGEILVSEKTTVAELAELLGQKPFRIVADLMELGVFANVKQTVDFELLCEVARKYGFRARNPV